MERDREREALALALRVHCCLQADLSQLASKKSLWKDRGKETELYRLDALNRLNNKYLWPLEFLLYVIESRVVHTRIYKLDEEESKLFEWIIYRHRKSYHDACIRHKNEASAKRKPS